MRATAVAHPNIALSKYWGKQERAGNYPATPSLSVTLSGLATHTTVEYSESFASDAIYIGGEPANAAFAKRACDMLSRIRTKTPTPFAKVDTTNDFPTASGLASSASGFAALATACATAAGLDWSREVLSDLARQSSASAARSIYGGFVELASDAGASMLAAREVAPPDHMDIHVIVCVATEDAKLFGSTEAMNLSKAGPYYDRWIEVAHELHREVREALLAREFVRMGVALERSALAMHACALSVGIAYWSDATRNVYNTMRRLREAGTNVFCSMDAGPHVKLFVEGREVEAVEKLARATPGVLRTIHARPAMGAHVIPSL